jgi:hypothetical protein
LALAALAAALLPTDAVWGIDQGTKRLQADALAAGSLLVHDLPDPATEFDPELAPISALRSFWTLEHNGRLLGAYPPLATTAWALGQRLAGPRGELLLSVFGLVATAALAPALAAALGCERPWLASWLVGIASPLSFYGFVLWEHSAAVAAAAAGTLAALAPNLAPRTPPRPYLVTLGAAVCGLGIGLRTEVLWVAPAALLALAATGRWRVAGRWAAGWALGVALIAGWHLWLCGHPLGPAIGVNFAADADTSTPFGLGTSRLAIAVAMLFDVTGWRTALAAGLLAVVAAAAPRLRSGAIAAAAGLAVVAATALPPQGLIAAFPPVLLAPLALPPLDRERRHVVVVLLSVLVLATLATAPSEGGWQWGPRYLFPALPLLAALAQRGAESLWAGRRLLGRATVGVLVALALVLSARSFQLAQATLEASAQLVASAQGLDADLLVADRPALPRLLGPLAASKAMVVASTAEDQRVLCEVLRRRPGVRAVGLSANSAPWGQDLTASPEVSTLSPPLRAWKLRAGPGPC